MEPVHKSKKSLASPPNHDGSLRHAGELTPHALQSIQASWQSWNAEVSGKPATISLTGLMKISLRGKILPHGLHNLPAAENQVILDTIGLLTNMYRIRPSFEICSTTCPSLHRLRNRPIAQTMSLWRLISITSKQGCETQHALGLGTAGSDRRDFVLRSSSFAVSGQHQCESSKAHQTSTFLNRNRPYLSR